MLSLGTIIRSCRFFCFIVAYNFDNVFVLYIMISLKIGCPSVCFRVSSLVLDLLSLLLVALFDHCRRNGGV